MPLSINNILPVLETAQPLDAKQLVQKVAIVSKVRGDLDHAITQGKASVRDYLRSLNQEIGAATNEGYEIPDECILALKSVIDNYKDKISIDWAKKSLATIEAYKAKNSLSSKKDFPIESPVIISLSSAKLMDEITQPYTNVLANKSSGHQEISTSESDLRSKVVDTVTKLKSALAAKEKTKVRDCLKIIFQTIEGNGKCKFDDVLVFTLKEVLNSFPDPFSRMYATNSLYKLIINGHDISNLDNGAVNYLITNILSDNSNSTNLLKILARSKQEFSKEAIFNIVKALGGRDKNKDKAISEILKFTLEHNASNLQDIQDIVSRLLQQLKLSNVEVQKNIIYALGNIAKNGYRFPGALNIQKILANYQGNHQDAVLYALKHINGDLEEPTKVEDIIQKYKDQTNIKEEKLRFIGKALLNHSDPMLRRTALKILNENKLTPDLEKLVNIERDSDNIELIKYHIKDHQLLTLSCFETLEKNLSNIEVLEILNGVLDNDQQQLPKSLTINLFSNLSSANAEILIKIIKQGKSELPDNLCQLLLRQIEKNQSLALKVLNVLITKHKALIKDISDADINSISLLIRTKEQDISKEARKLIISITRTGKYIKQEVMDELYNSGQEDALRLVTNIAKHYEQSMVKYQPYQSHRAEVSGSLSQINDKYKLYEHLDMIYSSRDSAEKVSAIGKIKAILDSEKNLPPFAINKLYQIIKLYSGQLKESCIALFADLLRSNPATILELNNIIIDDIQLSEDFLYIVTESALRGNITADSFNILLWCTIYGNESMQDKCKETLVRLNPSQISSNIPLQKYLYLGTCKDPHQIRSTIEYLSGNDFLLGDNGIKALEVLCTGEENFEYVRDIVFSSYDYVPSSKIAEYLNKYASQPFSEASDDKQPATSAVTHEEIINTFFGTDKFGELFPSGENEVSSRIVYAIAHVQCPDNLEVLKGCPVLHLSHKILSTSLYIAVQANDSSITEFDLDEYLSNIENLITLNIDQNYLDSYLIKLHELDNIKDINSSIKTFWIANKVKDKLGAISNSVVDELSNYLLGWDIESIGLFLQQYKDNTPQELLTIKSIATITPQIINNVLDSGKAYSHEVGDFIKAVNKELIALNFNLNDATITRLVDLDYSPESLNTIYDKAEQEFSKIIDLILDYEIGKDIQNYKGETILDIINAGGDICLNISKLGLEVKFANVGEEKDLEILLNELTEKNTHSTNPINIDNLRSEFEKINTCFTIGSKICTSLNSKAINSWTAEDIKIWASSAKNLKAGLDNHLHEVIAVIRRANILDSGQDPRTIHVLSLLLMSQGVDSKGTLAQIATGEGKTSIVSMLAIINALKGQKVDVITSSSILATDGAKKKGSFYSLFDLTVGDNGTEGQTGCYTKDIIYGSISNFQFDFLRDQYMLKGTRQNREFGVVIADEVDSMLIDEGSKIAMLSENIAGMEYLESLLAGVFATTTSFLQGFVHDDEGFLARDEDGNAMFVDPTDTEGSSEYIAVPDQKAFIMKQVQEAINKQFFSDQSTDHAFALPSNLKDFARGQVENWINMSLVASQMKPKADYVIQDNEIKPVDYNNTGIIQTNTQWQNGLHQFLQIKHGLRVSPESFTTCFISNIGYFKQYGNKIYGVTGTLGSEESKNLLSTTYGVDCVIVPTYRQKQFVELTGIIKEKPEEWINEVATSTKQEAAKGRGVLVICKTIDNVDEIENKLVELGVSKDQIIRYANNESDKGVDGISMKSGQIIIATNLAGRGTDINADEIEAFGGLHVCLTFLPNNLRVEEQAFGRTSRQGKRGTGQLIICDDGYNIKTIKEERSEREKVRLKLIETKEIREIDIKDKLFLGQKDENGNVVVEGFMPYIASIRNSQNKNIVRSIEERWGLFFAGLELKEGFKESDIIQQYNEFMAKIKADLSNEQAIKGHSYRTLIGNELCSTGKYTEAIKEFDKAIELDHAFSYAAHYNKAYAIIKNEGNIQEAKGELDRAKEIITETLVPQLQALMAVGSMYNHNTSTECSEEKPLTEYQMQFNTKLGLLEQHKKYIEEAVKIIDGKKADNSIVIDQEMFLEEMYPSQAETPTREIEELRGEGFSRLFSVKEKPPTDWLGIIGVFILGALQTIAGAALTMCGFANVGNALIAEGVSDFITGIKSAATGEFSWTDYLKDKAVSLAISVVTMGMSTIKSVVKAAGSVGAGLKQIGSQVKNGAKTFFNKVASNGAKAASTEGSKALTKEGMKVVMKNVAKEFVEQGAKELINLGVQAISKEILKQFENDIISAVKDTLGSINITTLNNILADQSTTKALEKAASDFLSKQSSELQNIAEQFIGAAVNGISKKVGAVLDATKISAAISEASSYTSVFVCEINSRMSSLSPKTSDTKATTDGGQLIDNWSKQIGDRIINIIHGKVLNPLTNKAVSGAVGHCSKHVQKSLSTQGHTFDDKLNLWQNKRSMRKNAEKIAQAYEHPVHSKNAYNKAVPHSKAQLLPKDREGGMLDAAALAAHLKQPIHIYKNGKLHEIIGKGDKPIAVDYTPPANGKAGHWEPHGFVKTTASSGKNNCLFDAVGTQLPHKPSGQDLRQIADNIRNNNSRHMNAAQNAEKFLLQNIRPDKAKNATMMGGSSIVELESSIRGQLLAETNLDARKKQEVIDDLDNLRTLSRIERNKKRIEIADKLRFLSQGNKDLQDLARMFNDSIHPMPTKEGTIEFSQNHGNLMFSDKSDTSSKRNVMQFGKDPGFRSHDLFLSVMQDPSNSGRFISDNNRGLAAHAAGDHRVENFVIWDHLDNDKAFRNRTGDGSTLSFDKNNPEGRQRSVIITDRTKKIFFGGRRQFDPFPEQKPHQGLNSTYLTSMEVISSPFYEYTMEGIRDILILRLRTEASNTELTNTLILPGTYIFSEKYSNIHTLLLYLNLYVVTLMLRRNKQAMNRVSQPVILTPISLDGRHAVGVMFVAQEDGSGYKAFYVDPENTAIPEGLAEIFKESGYEIEQLPTEGQRYTNCGPEVIENFMLYLTGERLSQEEAIVNNSRLVEQELLSSSHEAEEASCLTLKDSYSKQDAVTVISNVAGKTQVSSDGYIIGNPTIYDIVTPQSIIDEVVVSADLGREPCDVLLELVHDYRINQDYVESILGEVISIDIS